MDETPEEMAQIRVDADAIDVHQYQRRFRAMKAVGLGAAGAGLVWLILILLDGRRNPCERVRDYFCHGDKAGANAATCKMYDAIRNESVEDQNPQMRQSIRAQCQTKIQRLKDEDGIVVH
jgi:hypothetical protein